MKRTEQVELDRLDRMMGPDEELVHLQGVQKMLREKLNVTDLRTMLAHYWRLNDTRGTKWAAREFGDWSKPELVEAVAEAMIDKGDA